MNISKVVSAPKSVLGGELPPSPNIMNACTTCGHMWESGPNGSDSPCVVSARTVTRYRAVCPNCDGVGGFDQTSDEEYIAGCSASIEACVTCKGGTLKRISVVLASEVDPLLTALADKETEIATLKAEILEIKGIAACNYCKGCHPSDTVIPSVRWNAVIRGNHLPDYLCTTCIMQAFVTRGESFTGEIDGVPFEVIVHSQQAKDAELTSAENTELRATVFALTTRAEATEATITSLKKGIEIAIDALDNYSDVNDGEDGPVPNRAMSVITRLKGLVDKE